ncbi:MAG: sigma-70 family RNA polymerase sigma factor [Pseudonocardiaceae bacterium]
MDDLIVIFEEQRTHLRAVAYRLLGSVHEADDAVQEVWLRLERSDVSDVDNLPAWLTTMVSRICLDQLRSRASRREDLGAEPTGVPDDLVTDPAAEAEHADAVGRALMVVLDTLAPAERLAFCLQDLFGLSFDEIAPRSAAAAPPADSWPVGPGGCRLRQHQDPRPYLPVCEPPRMHLHVRRGRPYPPV